MTLTEPLRPERFLSWSEGLVFCEKQAREQKEVLIAGPTASGKNAFALDLSEKCSGVIINTDLFQAYEGMPIGTAQPSSGEKAQAPHALYGFRDPRDPLNLGSFLPLVRREARRAQDQGLNPLLVGGAGLVMEAYARNYSLSPPPSAQLQEYTRGLSEKSLREELQKKGMKEELKTVPKGSLHHLQRMLQRTDHKHPTSEDLLGEKICVIWWEPSALKDRIEKRLHLMIEEGWVEEVSSLMARGIGHGSPALKATGYREIGLYLMGEISLHEALEEIFRQTVQYAKRQRTWWRKKSVASSVVWIDGESRKA